MHDEHVFLSRKDGITIEGVIDFGDALLAPAIYELIATHICAFHCDKRLLRQLILGYTSTVPLFPDDQVGNAIAVPCSNHH